MPSLKLGAARRNPPLSGKGKSHIAIENKECSSVLQFINAPCKERFRRTLRHAVSTMALARSGAPAPRLNDAPRNVVGLQVRRLRRQQRLTQPALAARCQVIGYDLSRESLSKIEARLRSVSDAEVLMLADALKVPYTLLFPEPEQVVAALRFFKVQ